ncbi:MAG: YceI family protein [Chitinophagales bacterium]
MKSAFYISLFILASIPLSLRAQNAYNLTPGFTITISGSSNVHDWEELAEKATGDAKVQWNGDGSFELKELNLKIPVKNIKSDKGSIMDSKTYDALKADDHPYITFKMLSVKSMTKSGSGYAIKVNGELTIAGAKRNVDIDGMVYVKEGGKLYIDTSKNLKMTDFGIDPPTAMMGAMKVSDAISIRFKLYYSMQ